MNFFSKKTYQQYDPPKPQPRPVEEGCEYDINYQSSESSVIDEKVKTVTDLRLQKSQATDFYIKLTELKDRLDVFNDIFLSK